MGSGFRVRDFGIPRPACMKESPAKTPEGQVHTDTPLWRHYVDLAASLWQKSGVLLVMEDRPMTHDNVDPMIM